MAHAKFYRAAVVGAFALSLALTGCGGGTPKSGSNKAGGNKSAPGETGKGGTVTVYHAADFEHLDPARSFVTDSSQFGSLIYRTLTTYKWNPEKKQVTLEGDLAASWTNSPDFKTWTFKLKPGLKYEDGSVIKSKDIKYNAERSFSADMAEGAPYAHNYLDCAKYKGPYKPAGNNGGKGCEAIEVPDDNTIVFHLKEAVPEFNHTASMKVFAPTPEAKDTKTQYDNHPFSSGPYKIEKYERKKSLTLVRNTYWDAKSDPVRTALPDKWVIKFGDDPATVDQRLIANGKADQNAYSTGGIQPQNLAKLTQGNVKSRVVEGPDICRRYIAFNQQKKLLKDQNLREALALGLNKNAYIAGRGGDRLNTIVDSVIPEDLPGYRKQAQFDTSHDGDVAAAKAALKKSTYKGETLLLGASDATELSIKAAEAAQAAWQAIGVKVELKKIPGDNYYSVQQNDASATDLITAGWCYDWASLSTIVPPVFGPDPSSGNKKSAQNNYARSEAGWDKMAGVAAMPDPAARTEAWANLYEEIMKTVPLVPISKDNNVYVVGSNITNASANPDAGGLIDVTVVGLKKP